MDEKSAKEAVNQITEAFSQMVENMNSLANDLVTFKELIDKLDASMLDNSCAEITVDDWAGYTQKEATITYINDYDVDEEFDEFYKTVSSVNDDDVDLSVASLKLPGMKDVAPKCPEPLIKGSPEMQEMCYKPDMPLRTRIMHLNDDHRMSREDIAILLQKWHDAGEIDIAFKV